LEQKTAIAHEARAVLDSWVRYEGQVKQRQQRELAEAVIAKIEKELENPKVLKQILDQSVADVESKSDISYQRLDWLIISRNCVGQGIVAAERPSSTSISCEINLVQYSHSCSIDIRLQATGFRRETLFARSRLRFSIIKLIIKI
jgi:hypothetical protein